MKNLESWQVCYRNFMERLRRNWNERKVGSGTIWSVNNLSVPNFICAEPKFFTCWDLQQGSPSIGENGTGAEKSV